MAGRRQRLEHVRTAAARRRSAIPAALAGAAWLCGGCGQAGGGDTGAAERGAPSATEAVHFEFTEVVPGVYHARGASDLVVGSNAGVVVNEADVLLVDSHISPAAANALIENLRTLTDQPVRYAANTPAPRSAPRTGTPGSRTRASTRR